MRQLYSIIFILVLGFTSFNCRSQVNLVPNFSFEIHDTCPNALDQVRYATGWDKYCIDWFTPDYYNSCSSDTTCGIPNNFVSYQPDHRNCGAYMGLITWDGNTDVDRETIGTQLTVPMTVGQKYFISFYAVMGWEKFSDGWHYTVFSNNIGARLSTVPFNNSNPCPLDNFAHLNYTPILNDSVNWTKISGSIIADSAYQHIVIGNFFDNAHTDTLSYNHCPTCLNMCSYYLIDDVCISTDSLLCNGGIDAMACFTGLEEENESKKINIFPNPFNDYITIVSDNLLLEKISIYDVFGQVVYVRYLKKENKVVLDLRQIPNGIYYVTINGDNSNRTIFKSIIKQ